MDLDFRSLKDFSLTAKGNHTEISIITIQLGFQKFKWIFSLLYLHISFVPHSPPLSPSPFLSHLSSSPWLVSPQFCSFLISYIRGCEQSWIILLAFVDQKICPQSRSSGFLSPLPGCLLLPRRIKIGSPPPPPCNPRSSF